jgi:DNA-binding NarL/FixJ family response regulator
MNTITSTRIDKSKHRILIVDDHAIVRHGLGDLIARQPDMEVCGEATNVAEALQQLETTHPDAAIVDITLDGSNGIELIERMKTHYPKIKVLVSSMHDESLFAERALRAGALGYIHKQESIRKVIEAIRSVLRGDVYLSPHMVTQLIQHPNSADTLEQDPVRRLSNREMEVFQLIGQGLTTQEIAGKLHLSPSTVETHRRKIRTKLNLETNAQLNRYAFRWVEEGR